MRYYFAPMEGVTGYIYRNAYQKYFHNVDCYYTPFVTPTKTRCFSNRERTDLLPENNQGVPLVPQILTNRAENFIRTARELRQMGYQEVNLNLGCPSGTVVAKKKGAGFLAEPAALEHFLADIFAALAGEVEISIKTRIGLEQPEEFVDLLALYAQFPVKELIVHPRVQKDLYQHKPNWDVFARCVEEWNRPLCYNGDIFTVADYQRFCNTFPQVEAVMLGRGILRNPGLLDAIRYDKALDLQVLRQFHDELLQGYLAAFSGDRPVLFKMKELWGYLLPLFPDGSAFAKKIRKVERISEYQNIVEQIWMSC